jgi:hypothetical protein
MYIIYKCGRRPHNTSGPQVGANALAAMIGYKTVIQNALYQKNVLKTSSQNVSDNAVIT